MNENLISIIIPVYNKEKYIAKTISSFLDVAEYHIEIIIINDGSTDGSLAIVNKYALEYDFISVYSIENSGVSFARNYGIEKARGKWILFFDADDYVDVLELKRCFSILNKYNPDILFSGIKEVDKNGSILNNKQFSRKGFYSDLKYLFSDFASIQEKTGLYGCVSNKIIKSSIIKNHNIRFDTTITLAEDFDFFLDIYRYINNYYYFDKSYLYYLQNAENSSTSNQSEKIPNYFTQVLIKYKEYVLLTENNSYNLDVLRKRIADFFVLYLKNNYVFEENKQAESNSFILNILNVIYDEHLNKLNRFLIKLYKKSRFTTLKIIIRFQIYLKNIYHAVRR